MNETTEALLDIVDRAEEIDEALQNIYPDLERVCCEDIMSKLSDALKACQYIDTIAVKALGGIDAVLQLQCDRSDRDNCDMP